MSNNTKVNFLQDLCNSPSRNIIAIVLTETHLSPQILDAEVQISDFCLYRKDRADRSHGGVAIYLRNDLIVQKSFSYSNGVCEYICLKIKLESRSILLSNIYRPPNASANEFSELISYIEDHVPIDEAPLLDHLIFGDFNFPDLYRNELNEESGLPIRNDVHSAKASRLTSFTDHMLMEQIVHQSTRINNILDLIFINNLDFIIGSEVLPTTYSDHNLIFVKLNIRLCTEIAQKTDDQLINGLTNTNIHSADFKKVNQDLSKIHWTQHDTSKTIDKCFTELIHDIVVNVKNYANEKRPKSKTNKFKRERRKLWRQRTRIIKNMNVTQLTPSKLMDVEEKIRRSYEDEYLDEEKSAINKIKVNSKYFFSFAKRKLKTNDKIKVLKSFNNEYVRLKADICETLQEQFRKSFSCGTIDPNVIRFDPAVRPDVPIIDDIEFSAEDIAKEIKNMSISSAPGLDGITPKILKECSQTLSQPIYMLWRHSLDIGKIPKECKRGLISPIYKKGSRECPANYRPISLTSHIVKIFERVILRHLMRHFEENNLLADSQHGFRPGRSCLSQLLDYYTHLLDASTDSCPIDAIYLDYAKAFDKVNHEVIISKLQHLGVSGKLLIWIQQFLTNRTQIVTVDGATSSECKVTSGVPQGSVLGPFLFLIMINDLPQVMNHSEIFTFADDTKIVKKIKTSTDSTNLQNDLYNVENWTDRDLLELNLDKFVHLRFYLNKQSKLAPKYTYFSKDGQEIPKCNTVRDLGVLFNEDLRFNAHVDATCSKVRQLIGWSLRTFRSRDTVTIMTLWKSMLLPRVDYCSILLTSITQTSMQKLEGLQRTMTARIISLKHMSYWERIEHLGIYSINRRFERYLIIYVWKILENKVVQPNANFDTTEFDTRVGRKFVQSHVPAISPLFNAPMNKAKRLFNALPKSIRNITSPTSVNSFKNSLDKFLKSIPDEPSVPSYVCQRPANSNSIIDQIHYRRNP